MIHENTDIERLFKCYYQPMFRVAKGILYDHDECKDVVSEVFAKVYEEGIILLPETEEGYLIRAVRNRCLNIITRVRDKKRLEKVGNLVKNSYLYR